jgi:hypothetical protein
VTKTLPANNEARPNQTKPIGFFMTDQNKHSIATFAALKTSIANGEEQLVKNYWQITPCKRLKKAISLTWLN